MCGHGRCLLQESILPMTRNVRGPFFLSALIAAVVLFAAVKTVFGANWEWLTIPGEWQEQYEVKPSPFMCPPDAATTCTSFLAQVIVSKPTCLRYHSPKVFHNGREISGHATETGVPGEAGWQWSFQTDELFTGPFEWHVTTVDVCPKVS